MPKGKRKAKAKEAENAASEDSGNSGEEQAAGEPKPASERENEQADEIARLKATLAAREAEHGKQLAEAIAMQGEGPVKIEAAGGGPDDPTQRPVVSVVQVGTYEGGSIEGQEQETKKEDGTTSKNH